MFSRWGLETERLPCSVIWQFSVEMTNIPLIWDFLGNYLTDMCTCMGNVYTSYIYKYTSIICLNKTLETPWLSTNGDS